MCFVYILISSLLCRSLIVIFAVFVRAEFIYVCISVSNAIGTSVFGLNTYLFLFFRGVIVFGNLIGHESGRRESCDILTSAYSICFS